MGISISARNRGLQTLSQSFVSRFWMLRCSSLMNTRVRIRLFGVIWILVPSTGLTSNVLTDSVCAVYSNTVDSEISMLLVSE